MQPSKASARITIYLGVSIFSGFVLAQPLPSRVVAYTTGPAPASGTFVYLNPPAIGRNGDIAFRASPEAIFVERGGVLRLHSRQGGDARHPNHIFHTFSNPNIDPSGRISFSAIIANPTAGTRPLEAVYTEDADGLRLLAIEGASAPGVAGAAFSRLGDMPLVNDLGHRVFDATLSGAVTGSSTWLDNGLSLSLLTHIDSPPPGLAAGARFTFFHQKTFSPTGVFAFSADVSVDGQTQLRIWSTHGGALGLRSLALLAGNLRMNASGRIAFGHASPFGSSKIWLSDALGNPSVFYEPPPGDPPGVGWSVQRLGEFLLTDRNQLVSIGTIKSRSLDYVTTTQPAVFVYNGGFEQLAKTGDPAPGIPGAKFERFGGVVFGSEPAIAANASGQVAFLATISGSGITSANNTGIWAQDQGFALRLVARTGATIEVAPGDHRTVHWLELPYRPPGGGSDGGVRWFSDRGDVLWTAGLTPDNFVGSPRAIVVTNVGEAVVEPKLIGLEVVQVVQDWNNSIGLISGKRTIARAHVENPTPMRFDGRLRGFIGTTELPGSPLVPINPGGFVNIKPDAALRRKKFEDSINFELPASWVSTPGILTLQMEWFDGALDCAEAAGPAPNDCRADVGISGGYTPQIQLVSVNFEDAAGRHIVPPGLRSDLARRLLAAFPVASVDWIPDETNWDGSVPPLSREVLDAMGYRRALDDCSDAEGCKRIYYGAILGNKIDGIGWLPGSEGAGYVPLGTLIKGRQTHSHEVAHNLGIDHAVHGTYGGYQADGVKKLGVCGEEGAFAFTSDFPYVYLIDGYNRPTLGPLGADRNTWIYGLDTNLMRVVDPYKIFDLMSYCHENTLHLWPSEYTYGLLRSAIANRFGSPSKGVPLAVPQDYFLIRGWVSTEDGKAYFSPFGYLYSVTPDPITPGEYTLRLRDATDALLLEISFELRRYDDPIGGAFLIPVTPNPATRKVEVVHQGNVIGSRSASMNPPAITLTSPNGGESISTETSTISWTASDPDGDPLTYVIQFSRDGGATWKTLAVDWRSSTYEVARQSLQGTTNGMLRVLASDGFHVTSDTSNGAFSVTNNAPLAVLIAPVDGTLYTGDQQISFDGEAHDTEERQLAAASLAWMSSLSGSLGSGTGFARQASALLEGQHLITLTATDSQGASSTATATIRVLRQPPSSFGDAAAIAPYFQGEAGEGATVTYRVGAANLGPDTLAMTTLTFSATRQAPSGPSEAVPILAVEPGAGWNCSTVNQTVSCSRTDLLVDETHTISIRVGPAQLGTLVATTEVSSGTTDPALDNNLVRINTFVLPATRGDVNGDGSISAADIFYLINFLYAGGPDPIGLADVNGDGGVSVADVIYLIVHLFAGGPEP